jgi:catechol 2,3-dioxygenase-like lactoylglutathione lyase family enzyme
MIQAGKLVGFLVTPDYDRARAFYEGKLGLKFVSLDQFALVMRTGEHQIRITRIEKFTPAQNTVLGWEVQDVIAVATWLKERGVELEKYPFVQDSALGIWTAPSGDKVAWFKDPDGNVLSISQHRQREGAR